MDCNHPQLWRKSLSDLYYCVDCLKEFQIVPLGVNRLVWSAPVETPHGVPGKVIE